MLLSRFASKSTLRHDVRLVQLDLPGRVGGPRAGSDLARARARLRPFHSSRTSHPKRIHSSSSSRYESFLRVMSSQPRSDDNAHGLANFNSLPYELRAVIIKEACYPNRYFLFMERSTADRLMSVSRDVYAIVAPEWYRRVHIGRPSVLALFVRTLLAKPALGRLVKELWLGPYDLLPDRWWPMGTLKVPDENNLEEEDVKELSIATSLDDKSLLPRWCNVRHSWLLSPSRHGKLNCKDKAVLEAISAAQHFLGVDLKRPRHAPDGALLGSALWLIGVMEVQAALDLYLLHVRRLEDDAGVSSPGCRCEPTAGKESSSGQSCLEYPPLELTTTLGSPGLDTPSSAPWPGGSRRPYVLHRTRLLQHIGRRGAQTDSFDHPLLLARSGIKLITFRPDGRGYLSSSIWREAKELYSDKASSSAPSSDKEGSAESAFDNLALPESSSTRPLANDLVSPLDTASYHTASIGGNLALSCALLALTPDVQSLFLTGVLQRICCGKEAALPPRSLRYLCLGPFSWSSDESLSPSFADGRLRGLEQLDLRGGYLCEHKRACIAALPSLKRVHWDLQHSHASPPG